VVLYELVCGRLPYEVSRTNVAEATRVIQEMPPVRPKQAQSAVDDDLETVVLTAIHKDRSRRYQDAAALASDIRRAIAGEPIEARRDSATYVLRKRASTLASAHRISLWIVIVLVAFVFAKVIGLVMEASGLQLLFHRTVTSRIAPASAGQQMSKVAIIRIRDNSKLESLAKELGIVDFRIADLPTLRLLHHRLMQKLADAGPKVVTFDILFPATRDDKGMMGECRYEQELLDGIRKLQDKGIPVVLSAGGEWRIGEDQLPPSLCKALARETRWGFATAVLSAHSPWSLELLILPTDRHPMPSLALVTCAAYWRPDRHAWMTMEADRSRGAAYAKVFYAKPTAAQPRAWGAPAEALADRVRLSQVIAVASDEPSQGKKRDDVIGHSILHVPPDAVLERATIDYDTVLRASPAELRKQIAGKVVVIGDAREGMDGPHQSPDGRSHSGYVSHAVGIDSILSSTVILAPHRVKFAGVSISGRTLFDLLATATGGTLAVFAGSRWRRWILCGFLVVILVSFSLLMYWRLGTLYDPSVALIGATAAIVGVTCLRPASRSRFI
jgi:CHASE2 domain-containing sensor protein